MQILCESIEDAKNYDSPILLELNTVHRLQTLYQEQKQIPHYIQRYKALAGYVSPHSYPQEIDTLKDYIYAYRGKVPEPRDKTEYGQLVFFTGSVVDILIQRFIEEKVRETKLQRFMKGA